MPKSEVDKPHSIARWFGRAAIAAIRGRALGGLPVDHPFELGWCLHRKVTGLVPLLNTIDERCRPPKKIQGIDAVRKQAAVRDEKPEGMDRRQTVPRRQGHDQLAMARRKKVKQ